jgi:hypothetical protein
MIHVWKERNWPEHHIVLKGRIGAVRISKLVSNYLKWLFHLIMNLAQLAIKEPERNLSNFS